MARREFLLYSRARRFAAPCRVGYETGENYGKRRWKAVVENDSGTAYSNRPRRHRFAPWRKSLAVANRLPAVCISFAAFARARFSTADGRLPAAADVAEPSETSDDPASLEPPSEASLRASIRNPNATTSVKAAARSSATAKSPVNAPAKIESAVRAMSSSVGAWSTPAIAEAVVATGLADAPQSRDRFAVLPHPRTQQIQSPQNARQRVGVGMAPQFGDHVHAFAVHQRQHAFHQFGVLRVVHAVKQRRGRRMAHFVDFRRIGAAGDIGRPSSGRAGRGVPDAANRCS